MYFTGSVSVNDSVVTDESQELSLPANVVIPPVLTQVAETTVDNTTNTSETDSQSLASHSILSHTTRNQSL